MLNHKMQGIQLKTLDPRIGREFPLPSYATESAAGLDLRACIDSALLLAPGKAQLISAGIALYIENPWIAAIILPRSGLGHKKGIILGNGTGVIDADYQGELLISCWNRSDKPFTINAGDRIAQLVFVPVIRTNFEIVSEFNPSGRGEKGFGHSGMR